MKTDAGTLAADAAEAAVREQLALSRNVLAKMHEIIHAAGHGDCMACDHLLPLLECYLKG